MFDYCDNLCIAGICALAQPWEGFVIGGVGAILALLTIELLDRIKVDDPVGESVM